MRDFPSCFGENGVQVADSSSSSSSSNRSSQNLVSCLYSACICGRSSIITISWTKSVMGGQALGILIEDSTNQNLCKFDIKPWLFSKWKGSKTLELETSKVEIFWDLSSAKFGPSPEPLECFYVAVVVDLQMVLLLGDLTKEAFKKTNVSSPQPNSIFVAKKEHIFGKKVYSTKAQFSDTGENHDIAIECVSIGGKDLCLEIRIDKKRVLQVKRLSWKFRGNQTMLVDGLPVEVFWDVHNWLFGASSGSAVFMFHTCLSTEKLLPWSCSETWRENQPRSVGFSLVLYAWKNE